jgi:Fe-S-cluster containining protein
MATGMSKGGESMNEYDWNADRFTSELADRLTVALAGVEESAALAKAVSDCAAAAEELCTGRLMACKAGCPDCCVLNVAVLLPEAMIVAGSLREKLSPAELEEMQKRLGVHRSWARWMDDEERILKQMTCPFLDAGGSCSIHPVRPLACRAVASLDAGACKEAFAPTVTDEPRLIPVDLLRQAAYDAAFTALAQSLKANGLDDRSIELGAGVLAFLEHPEYEQEMLGGKNLPGTMWQ